MSEVSLKSTVERYVELEQLGHGGMGSVHRVLDREGGRCLALKRLNTARARNPAGLTEMFHQEFRTLARLRHPHVVEVYDFGVDAHGPYYTMEWLDGDDLHALAPLPWRDVCALGRDVCSALALLHSRRLIHRDTSPRNIKRLRSSRAKLIDFGGMMAMDVARNTVGTAPLVAPEVMLHQVLDARTDLYALGGTLYFALTGRHAYPVQSMGELGAQWRIPPAPPSAYVPEVPPGLDQLVLSMLSLEQGARPRSAAEVLERLSALADLPADEQLGIPNAYLSTPELVGREPELQTVRKHLRAVRSNEGGVLWICGEPGVGRSRMLSAAGLEAKLAGANVLYARADGSGVPYALLRDLLARALPSARYGLVQRVAEGDADEVFDRSYRAELLAELSDWLKERASLVPLVLTIDDLDRADEPSQAALAAVAAEASDLPVSIVVACVAAPDAVDTPALALLSEDATLLELSALRGEETRSLLGSMFGDVPNLAPLAVRIHELAEGSPRGAVDLARFLVDSQRAHYHLGAWRLPPVDDAGLPRSLTRARRQRLQALSDSARELAAALALADGAGLPAVACLELISDADPQRARAALDELLASQILQRDGMRYAFEAQCWAAEFRSHLQPEAAQRICRRIAAALGRHGRDPLEIARYAWLAGDSRRLVETLLAELAHGTRADRCPREYAAMLSTAATACVTLNRSQRDWFVLMRELVKVGQDLSVPDMREHLRALFEQLALDSGLVDARTLPADLSPLDRATRTLELAQHRYAGTPRAARCLAPLEALEAMSRLTNETVAFAAQIADAKLFELIPELHVFVPLSPEIEHVVHEIVPAARDLVAGRYEAAKASHLRSLALVTASNTTLFDAQTRTWGELVLHYALGCLDAAVGRSTALEHAARLEQAEAWLVPAWTVRHVYFGALGHAREADRARKRVELLLLQSAIKPPLAAGAAQQHVYTASISEDVTGLRECMGELKRVIAQQPMLQPFLEFAQAEYLRVCGDGLQALEIFGTLGRLLVAGDYPLWAPAIGAWMTTLADLDRSDDALRLGLKSVVEAERVNLVAMKHYIDVPLGLVEAKLGRFDSAKARIDAAIAMREAEGFEGATLGWVYEARARVAIRENDEGTFEKYAQLCRQQYRKTGGNPALAAKYERLMQEARKSGAPVSEELAETLKRSSTAAALATTHARDRDSTVRMKR
jgi:Protein kinase domain/AAA ATPase domain